MAIINTALPTYINDLVNYRKSRGISQKELAMRIEIDAAALCRIERGKRKMSARILEKICDELGLMIRLERISK